MTTYIGQKMKNYRKLPGSYSDDFQGQMNQEFSCLALVTSFSAMHAEVPIPGQ